MEPSLETAAPLSYKRSTKVAVGSSCSFPQCWTRDEVASLITMGCAWDCRPRGVGWDYCYSLCEQQGSVEWHSAGISLLSAGQAPAQSCFRGARKTSPGGSTRGFYSLVCLLKVEFIRVAQMKIERWIVLLFLFFFLLNKHLAPNCFFVAAQQRPVTT